MHDFTYELGACAQDQVTCKKNELKCLGSCSGVDGTDAKHDFATTVTIAELSEFALGEGFDTVAAANCTIKTATLRVPTFEGGDSFGTFAARLQSRSGMLAVDKAWCENNAQSCSVIQRVLEKVKNQPGTAPRCTFNVHSVFPSLALHSAVRSRHS